MKSTYEPVTRWVRFHATIAAMELKLCNSRWISPMVHPFLSETGPAECIAVNHLSLIEEVATAVWLMHDEFETLKQRVTELFGPKQALELSTSVETLLARPVSPSAGVRTAVNSMETRIALVNKHADKVDAHTRLVFHKHAFIVAGLVVPALEKVLDQITPDEPAETASPAEFAEAYDVFAPETGRPHPDDFLAETLPKRSDGGYVRST